MTIDEDLAGAREVHSTAEVEQSRFTTAAATDQGNELAGFDLEGDAGQGGDGRAFCLVNFSDTTGFEDGH